MKNFTTKGSPRSSAPTPPPLPPRGNHRTPRRHDGCLATRYDQSEGDRSDAGAVPGSSGMQTVMVRREVSLADHRLVHLCPRLPHATATLSLRDHSFLMALIPQGVHSER